MVPVPDSEPSVTARSPACDDRSVHVSALGPVPVDTSDGGTATVPASTLCASSSPVPGSGGVLLTIVSTCVAAV